MARILIAGQAPGRRAHLSGLPFDDASGDRLRQWLGVTRECFYDDKFIAIVPMGFCYPGSSSTGDLPPRPECAATWRAALLERLPNIELTVVLGQYALAWHGWGNGVRVTDAVRDWQNHWPHRIALPHPSPRNQRWFKANPYFELEVLPRLRERVATMLTGR